jgi:hypothetical protein
VLGVDPALRHVHHIEMGSVANGRNKKKIKNKASKLPAYKGQSAL